MGHDLLELYFGRRLGPSLKPEINFVRISDEDNGEMVGKFLLSMRATNIGQRIARFSMLLCTTVNSPDILIEEGPQYGSSFFRRSGQYLTFGSSFPNDVIHPGLSNNFLECRVSVRRTLANQNVLPLFFYGYHADGMKEVKGRAFLDQASDGTYNLRISSDDSALAERAI